MSLGCRVYRLKGEGKKGLLGELWKKVPNVQPAEDALHFLSFLFLARVQRRRTTNRFQHARIPRQQ